MKKITSFFLIAALMLSSVGCTGENTAQKPESPTQTASPSAGAASPLSFSADDKIEGEITISCYDPMTYKNFVEEAAAKFEQKYPGTKINFESFSSMPEIKTTQMGDNMVVAMISMDEDADSKRPDYINKINTEIMSGAGPDILAVDVIPYYQYANIGQIEDLGQYMEADPAFNKSNYRSNILDGLKYSGKNYIFPMNFTFDLLAYEPELYTEQQLAMLKSLDKMTYSEIVAMVEAGFTKTDGGATVFSATGGSGRGSFFNTLFDLNYGQFVDIANKKAAFNTGEFAALLELAKEYEEKGYIKQGFNGKEMSMESIGSIMQQSDIQQNYFKSLSCTILMEYLSSYYTDGVIKNSIMMNGSMLGDTDEIMGLTVNNDGGINFDFSQAFAINSNSKNKRLAWEFIKFMASDEMQSSLTLSGIPINNKSVADKAKRQAASQGAMRTAPAGAYTQAGGPASGGQPGQGGQPIQGGQPGQGNIGQPIPGEQVRPDGANQGDNKQGGPMVMMPGSRNNPANELKIEDIILTEQQQKIYNAYMEIVGKYAPMLNNCPVKDSTIESIVDKETEQFFNGSKTAAEVASIIQNRAELYINE